jgi:hypothetical protein
MDAVGAAELRKRLEEQAHWRQAEAVRDGRQSAADPDSLELEEVGEGVRFYGRAEERTLVEGRRALVTQRACKRLVDGWWEARYEVARVRFLDEDVPRGLTDPPSAEQVR